MKNKEGTMMILFGTMMIWVKNRSLLSLDLVSQFGNKGCCVAILWVVLILE